MTCNETLKLENLFNNLPNPIKCQFELLEYHSYRNSMKLNERAKINHQLTKMTEVMRENKNAQKSIQ